MTIKLVNVWKGLRTLSGTQVSYSYNKCLDHFQYPNEYRTRSDIKQWIGGQVNVTHNWSKPPKMQLNMAAPHMKTAARWIWGRSHRLQNVCQEGEIAAIDTIHCRIVCNVTWARMWGKGHLRFEEIQTQNTWKVVGEVRWQRVCLKKQKCCQPDPWPLRVGVSGNGEGLEGLWRFLCSMLSLPWIPLPCSHLSKAGKELAD